MLILLLIMASSVFCRTAPPPRKAVERSYAPRVLYKFHVESFARLDDSSIAVGHCQQLLATHNSGKTWELVGELPERNIIKQIVWIDSKHVDSPSPVMVNASFTGHGKIYYSCDGGRSFEASLRNTASSSAIVWDSSSDRLYAVDNTPRIYCSMNFGKTWQPIGTKISCAHRDVSHVCSLASFVEYNRRDFYVTKADAGEIFRTEDTGKTWQRVFSDSAFRDREIPKLGKLHDGRFFAVTAEGMIDAPGTVLIGSRDGGGWKNVPAPEGLWGFDELPSRPGFIVAGGFSLGRNAGDAALFLTNNYGRTWERKQVLNAALVSQVECFAPDSWILATDHGLLQLNINQLN
ncbi:MAG: WD40/YVTN/BNR-like repeat-containing protein [Candidatus Saccharimonadales bacterium]